MTRLLFLLTLSVLLSPLPACAVVASTTGLAIDSLFVMGTTFVATTFVPTLFIFGIGKLIYEILFGHHWGPYTIRLVAAGVAGALGIGGIARLFGGAMVSSMVFGG